MRHEMRPKKRGRPSTNYQYREKLVFFVGFRVDRGLHREMMEHRDSIPYKSWSDAFRAFARDTVDRARRSVQECEETVPETSHHGK